MELDLPVRMNGTLVLVPLPVEIWRLVGEMIQGPKTLQALVATCRTFRTVFSPFLFASCDFHLDKYDPWDPKFPAGGKFTKELRIAAFLFRDREYEGEHVYGYGRVVARLIRSMPHLEAFSWLDVAWEEYGLALILHSKGFRTAFDAAAAKIRKLHLSFTGHQLVDMGDSAVYSFLPLKGFSNMVSLEIYKFFGDFDILTKDIAALLSRSPGLKALGLGLACDEVDFDGIHVDRRDFFELLCLEYSSLGGLPLRLDTLRLGYGMCVCESEVTSVRSGPNFLEGLFRVECLRVLHLYNGQTNLQINGDENDLETVEVAWNLLKNCCSLRQVALCSLGADAAEWLNTPALRNVTELIITDNTNLGGNLSFNLAALQSRLTVLHAVERETFYEDSGSSAMSDWDAASPRPLGVDDISLQIDDNQETQLSSTESAVEPNIDSDLNFPPGGSFELSAVEPLGLGVATVLDRLKDHGTSLRQLVVALELDFQWEHFLSRLTHLTHLTHLYITCRDIGTTGWPPDSNALWEGAHGAREIAWQHALVCKSECESLRFVRVQDWAWQFTSKEYDDAKGEVRFKALDLEWEEVRRIECFGWDLGGFCSGLPRSEERVRERKADEGDGVDE